MFFCLAGLEKENAAGIFLQGWCPAGGILPLILPPGQKQLGGGLISATSG